MSAQTLVVAIVDIMISPQNNVIIISDVPHSQENVSVQYQRQGNANLSLASHGLCIFLSKISSKCFPSKIIDVVVDSL